MKEPGKERELCRNEHFCLTTHGLKEPGLEVRVCADGRLHFSREGQSEEVRECGSGELSGCANYRGNIPVLTAVYRQAARELRENIRPGGLMLAGKSWHTVWTRDIAYACALGAGLAEPAACRSSLESRVKDGRILQDTGTGGGWPVSTDRVSWALGARVVYQVTGDREWLGYCVDVLRATLEQDDAVLTRREGLLPGETSFLDWREQSYPDWMSIAEIGASCALGTNVQHYLARMILAEMLRELGDRQEAAVWEQQAECLGEAIEKGFWNRATFSYGMYRSVLNKLDEHTDALATAMMVLSGLAAGEHAQQALDHLPRTDFGTPVFTPFKSGLPAAYHNRAVWPFVEGFVLQAHAELQDTEGAGRSMMSLVRAALAFGTNKENLHAETGAADGTIQNSDRQLWSVAGVLGMYYYGLFGIRFEQGDLTFAPCVPKSLAGSHWLSGLKVRDMVLNIHINGYGTEICSVMINGAAAAPIIPLDSKGQMTIELELNPAEDEDAPLKEYPEACEDLPAPEWDSPTADCLRWQPVPGALAYYVYEDGQVLTQTAKCSYEPGNEPGDFVTEYRLRAIDEDNASSLSKPWERVAPGARHLLKPRRIGEEAEYRVENGQAWLDTRPCTAHLTYECVTLAAGTYRVRLQYCNATNSRRDGDSCALRALYLNGEKVGIIPLPHNTEAGNWEDYSMTAPVTVEVQSGVQNFSLRYTEDCLNTNGEMNQCMVRALEVTRVS